MKKQFLKVILTVVIFISLNNSLKSQDISSINNNVTIKKTELIEIKESDYVLGSIVNMNYHDNKILLVDESRPSISTIDLDGNLNHEFISEGRGPGEFLRPRNIFIKNDDYFIWDRSNLKLIQYDSNFNFKKEYSDLINHSISDFIVHEDLFFAFSSGTTSGATIYGIDLEKSGSQVNQQFGNKSQAQVLLMRIQGNGGITADSDFIYYVTPDIPTLKAIDIETSNEIEVSIDFTEFSVPEIENAANIINRERQRLPEIFSSSSYITNVYSLEDFIVVEAHTGTMDIGMRNNLNLSDDPYKDRNLQLAIFNKELTQIDLLTIDEPEMFSSLVRTTNKNSIYFLYQDIPHIDSNYQIKKITLK